MVLWMLWVNSVLLLWLAFIWILNSSPEVREVRSFPDAESHTSSNTSPQEGQGENLQGQRG